MTSKQSQPSSTSYTVWKMHNKGTMHLNWFINILYPPVQEPPVL